MEINVLTDSNKELKEQLMNINKSMESLQQELQQLREQHQSAMLDILKFKQEIDNLKNTITESSNEKKQLSETIYEMEILLKHLKLVATNYTTPLANKEKIEKQALTKQYAFDIHKKDNKINELQDEIHCSNQYKEKLHQNAVDLNKNIEHLQSEFLTNKENLAKVTLENEDLTQSSSDLSNRIANLKNTIEVMEKNRKLRVSGSIEIWLVAPLKQR